jgi:hypothetical protein
MDTPADSIEAARSLALEFGVEFRAEVGSDALDPALVRGSPVEWARSHALLPVRLKGELCLLTADPSGVDKHQDIALLVGGDLRPVVVPREVILK